MAVNKSTSIAYHLPDSRPHKTRCGQDRVTPLGPVRMADHAHPVDCRSCIRLDATGHNSFRSGGDWIRR